MHRRSKSRISLLGPHEISVHLRRRGLLGTLEPERNSCDGGPAVQPSQHSSSTGLDLCFGQEQRDLLNSGSDPLVRERSL